MKRKELPEWVRKIADKMYPQIHKDSYSKWEVEKLLIAVLDEADLLKEKVITNNHD